MKLAGGTTIAQAITILVSPILTRLYHPEAFGLVALFATMTSIIGVVACLRYELAILLPKNDDEAANVLGASLLAATFMAAMSGLLVLLCRGPILRLLETEALTSYLWLIPIIVLFSAAYTALNYWNSRMKLFGRQAITRTAQSFTTNGFQLALGSAGLVSAGSLIWGTVGGTIIATLILATLVWREDGPLFRKAVRLDKIVESFKRHRKLPLFDSWGSLLNMASQQLPILVLGIYFTEVLVGYYALAYRVIYLPMTLIGGAIGQVFFQRAAEVHSKGGDLGALVTVVFRRLVMVALLPSLLITSVGREMFVLIFGSNWIEAGTFAQILGLWMFFRFVSAPLTTLFVVLDRLELALVVHVVLLVTRVAPLVIGGMMGNVHMALGLFAGSGIVVYGALMVWCTVLAGVSIFSQLCIVWREMLYAMPVVSLVLLFKYAFNAPAWLILVACAIGLIAYGLLLLRRDSELSNYLRTLMQRFGYKRPVLMNITS